MRQTILILILVAVLAGIPSARPYKTPVIDGTIAGDGVDWDPDDLGVDDPLGDTAWGPNDIDDLWVTWDADNLYIGVRYQIDNNAMIVLLDTKSAEGVSDINGIDWYARNFQFADPVLADIIIANWNGGGLGVRRIVDSSTTEDITAECQVANNPQGNFFYEGEIAIPWSVLYGGASGHVEENASLNAVALIAGGDNWNGPDSAPDNPGMDGSGSPTMLINFHSMTIDGNGDMLPDSYEGAIEGNVYLEDALDDETVPAIEIYNEDGDILLGSLQTSAGGGPYRFEKLPDGSFRIEAFAQGYARIKRPGLIIEGQNELTGIDLTLTRAGKITGSVSFQDGPGADATVAAYDRATGLLSGEGKSEIPATGGDYELLLPDGEYYIVAEARGYVPDTLAAVITESDSVHAGTSELYAVRATKLVLIDNSIDRNILESVSTTVSYPDSGIYFYATALIEARDDYDRRDYYNLDGFLSQIDIRATKLNNITEPRGDVRFYRPPASSQTEITSFEIFEGLGAFLMTSDEIEVLRIFTESSEGDITGRFKLGIRSAEPKFIELTSSRSEITADGIDEVLVEARLLDISKNPVAISDIPITFSLAPGSTGDGTFAIPSTTTSPDGEASTTLTATVAGILQITASGTYMNTDLEVLGEGDESYIEVDVLPGEPAALRLSTVAEVVGFGEELVITAQLTDQFGNDVMQGGYSVTFSHTPLSSGSIAQTTLDLDGEGRAVTLFTAGSERSVVLIDAVSSPPLVTNQIAFEIDDIKTIIDPPYPEPDQDHNSLAAMDLTTVLVSNTAEYLNIRVRFSTGFDGAHIVILLESGNDPAGATADPFLFPVSYGHDDKPDYALTYKYSSDDYADMRRWSGSEWEWWDAEGKQYISTSSGTWVQGIDIHSTWITKDEQYVNFRIPFDFLQGGMPADIGIEVYLTQEADGTKRSAFDSAPHDATLDLDFDPADPEADWSLAEIPVVLGSWSERYPLMTDFPVPPILSAPSADPDVVEAGGMVTFSVAVSDGGDGIGLVLIDLSPIGGSRFQALVDDGTGGDQTAGDGRYSYRHMLDPSLSGGEYGLTITAKDAQNISKTNSTLLLTVEGTITAIRIITDETGDDHGPNRFGMEGLYYLYPSNVVFVQNAFDLERLVIFETSSIVGGEIIPSLAFQVDIGNLPDPADEGTADWNPLYADINIQKIDIYIDAFKGGATQGLPSRQNDFRRWDAWDYAIIMEGWYKGVITSNNQNTPLAWANSVKKTDRDIILLSDFENNTMTAVVSLESLGNPTPDDINSWDIMVLMTGHDGHSDDNNFGDTRWVNSSSSEWNFGGGGDLDRDSNIIDLMSSPGVGHIPGRDQSELLDYKSDEAVARLEEGLTAVVLETSAFEDQGPPSINVGDIVDETLPITPLVNAALYYTALIIDDDEVSGATFRWRADSVTTGTWMEELAMGYAGNDVWSIDLPVEQMLELVPLAPFDSTANIEFQIEAVDRSGNTAVTPLYTMEIFPPSMSYEVRNIDMSGGFRNRAPEGTYIDIPLSAIPRIASGNPFLYRLWSGYAEDFPRPMPPASGLNIFRTIEFNALVSEITTEGDTVVTELPLPEFDHPITLSLHYPQYMVAGLDEDLLGVYELNETTQTWIYIGGTVNPFGNLVSILISRPGTYALFYNTDYSFSATELFSGISFSPNPFSPNGDGLYEETNISFYLTEEATVTIEIYDMDGNRKRILEKRVSFTAEDTPDGKPRRITGITWDGKDNTGVTVPYGIYVVRFTVTYQHPSGERTIRKNAAVAVIK